MHYSQIDLAERRKIQQLRDAKIPVKAIAAELGPVDIHRNQMILAMKWAMARKFLAVFS